MKTIDRANPASPRQRGGSATAIAIAAAAVLSLSLGGCGTTRPALQCPRVIDYTDAQLDAIQQSINRLPKGDALRGAMQDYETLRDDARYCANLLKEHP